MAARFAAVCVMLAVVLTGCTAAPVENLVQPAVQKPERPPVDPIQQYADDRLSVMTLTEKIESMLMLHVSGTDPAALAGFASAWHVGGLILMGDNVPDPEDQLPAITANLSSDPGLPILVAMDQEGGEVRRLLSDEWDSAEQLRFEDPSAAQAAFAARGALLKADGVSLNFGVIADVTDDPSSFIYDRSMGATGADAAPRVAAAVTGERGQVLTTLKHFPGHGVAPGDSHSSIPETGISLDDWRTNHALPFEAGIAAGAEVVMFGHLQFDAVDAVPATLSPTWHQILRDELGFTGIAITDDMTMLQNSGRPEYANPSENAIQAISAGNTMLLYVGSPDPGALVNDIAAAVAAGRITEAQIDDAARRLLVVRRELSGQTGRFSHCFEQCQSMLD
ncbi:MAG: glycoside hydrolase family 3 N-terminal domain-containing protein [Rhodoglobus sp.]